MVIPLSNDNLRVSIFPNNDDDLSNRLSFREVDRQTRAHHCFVRRSKVLMNNNFEIPIYSFARENTLFTNITEK